MRGLGNHDVVVVAALGITTTDLQTALQSGKTIAQIAADKGVTVQKVIDAWVADEQQEHPEMTAADITARVTAMVNGTLQGGRAGGPRGATGSVATSGSTTATAAA
jgi:hypothetical protein